MADKKMHDRLDSPADAWSVRGLCRYFGWVSVALVFYVLSTGPVVSLMFKGKISASVVEMVYAPIIWVAETNPGEEIVEPFFDWYGEKVWRWRVL